MLLAALLCALALVSAPACRCTSPRPRQEVDGAGAAPDAAPDASGRRETGPVRACKSALEGIDEVAFSERAVYTRSKCAALFGERPCREGLEGLADRPSAEQVAGVVTACTAAYCPRLGDGAAPLCSAGAPDPAALDRSLTYEFGRLGGDAVTLDRAEVPLHWARTVAFSMTFDWLPPTAPSGPEPTERLRASLRPESGRRSTLTLWDADGVEVGRWTFSGDDASSDVEEALDAIEGRVRGRIVDLEADRSVHGKTLVRVRTGLLFLGARPITPMGG